ARNITNIEFPQPYDDHPGSNSWTTKSATYPDNHVNNMACSVLNDTGTDYIYCAGGSEFTGQTTSGHVFRYDPVADSITTVPSNWPPGDNGTLPGGFTVFNNKLRHVNCCNVMYDLGGNFNAPTNEVQIYDPVSGTWSVGPPFEIAGRNFAADTDGTNNIWKAGGYDSGLAIIATMEIFNCPN